MEPNSLFSTNLVRLRKARGFSQRELATKTGLTQRMINLYEHNPQSLPVDRLKALADSLNVKISDFFNEDEDSPLDSLDVRWLKKMQEIQGLSEADKKELNQHINSLLEKSRLRKDRQPV